MKFFLASTVMSGKFGLVSGKSQGNVREFCFFQSVYRGSYMSAHALLNLLNELAQRV